MQGRKSFKELSAVDYTHTRDLSLRYRSTLTSNKTRAALGGHVLGVCQHPHPGRS